MIFKDLVGERLTAKRKEKVMIPWISSISTLIIAIFTGINIVLILKIKSKDDEYRQQVSDLYKAIVISNIVANRAQPIDKFKKYYEQAGGKIKIFD